jgi:hypothetical protein
MVKYLGVKVTVDRKEQTKEAREQIEKNIRIMRWRLGRAVGCLSVTGLLPLQIHAYIPRNSNGCSRTVKATGYGQNRGKSISKGSGCEQYDLEQGRSEYHD